MRYINKEDAFSSTNDNFAVGPTSGGYTLAYSVDGINFSNCPNDTPAGETLVVNGFPEGMIFKLLGNVDNSVKLLD